MSKVKTSGAEIHVVHAGSGPPILLLHGAPQTHISWRLVAPELAKPHTVIDNHTPAFSVKALVVQGEMWLTVGDRTRHLRAGDRFELDYGVPHAERYGAEGATYWVARRLAPKT